MIPTQDELRLEIKAQLDAADPSSFKVGDAVRVVDRRDYAVINFTTITADNQKDGYVTVAAGYRVSRRCLLPF